MHGLTHARPHARTAKPSLAVGAPLRHPVSSPKSKMSASSQMSHPNVAQNSEICSATSSEAWQSLIADSSSPSSASSSTVKFCVQPGIRFFQEKIRTTRQKKEERDDEAPWRDTYIYVQYEGTRKGDIAI